MKESCELKNKYDENLELLRAWRAGNEEAGNKLVLQNTPLVYKIASRFSGRCPDMSDVYEVGTVGLVKAMKTFDFSRECAFSTYAVPLILGEIRRFLRDDGMIKVSREEKRLSALLNAERERRCALGEEVSIEALASAVGVSVQDASSALFASFPVKSLDERAYDDDDAVTLGSVISEDGAEESSFDKLAVRSAIEKLPDEQKKLIILRYFRDMSQSEVAKIMGLTQVKVSREEKKILARLRQLC